MTKSSLFDEILECKKTDFPSRCAVSAIALSLTVADRSSLSDAMAMPMSQVPHTAIRSALMKRGFEVNAQRISAHRCGTCKCANGSGWEGGRYAG